MEDQLVDGDALQDGNSAWDGALLSHQQEADGHHVVASHLSMAMEDEDAPPSEAAVELWFDGEVRGWTPAAAGLSHSLHGNI